MTACLIWLLGLLIELSGSLLRSFVVLVRIVLAIRDWHHTRRTQRKRPG